MTWKEFKEREMKEYKSLSKEQTDIKCPNCGKFLWKRTDVVLTSYPPQYQYECDCGWIGYGWR